MDGEEVGEEDGMVGLEDGEVDILLNIVGTIWQVKGMGNHLRQDEGMYRVFGGWVPAAVSRVQRPGGGQERRGMMLLLYEVIVGVFGWLVG